MVPGMTNVVIENRSSLDQYLTEIGRTPLLTKQMEIELSRQIKAGLKAQARLDDEDSEDRDRDAQLVVVGQQSLELLIRANLRLVVSVARRYHRQGVDLLDLIQEGNIGLMTAAKKFDPTRGFRFSTYATGWIRSKVGKAVGGGSRVVALPDGVVATITTVQRAQYDLLATIGREPTLEEIAEEAGMRADRVVELMALARQEISLDGAVNTDSDTPLGDLLPDTTSPTPCDAVTSAELEGDVALAMQSLSDGERYMIQRRFGIDNHDIQTRKQIGISLGVGPKRSRQIQNAAINKLRHHLSKTVTDLGH